MVINMTSAKSPSHRRSRRARRRAARRNTPIDSIPNLSPVHHQPQPQEFDNILGTRLVENLGPLFAVILSVLTSRVYYGDLFKKRISESAGGLELRLMARDMPPPTLHQIQEGFCDAVFNGAREFIPTLFDGEAVDDIRPYLERLFAKGIGALDGEGSKSVLLLMLVYLDRLFASCPAFMLTSKNVTKMMAAAYTVAFKVLEDVNWGVVGLVNVVGIDCKELCALESAFLRLLDYRLAVSAEEFRAAEIKLAAEALDAKGGADLLIKMHKEGVDGIALSLDIAKNWIEFVPPPGDQARWQELSGLARATFFVNGNRSWRMRLETDPLPYDWEWEIRKRQQKLAGALYACDFGHLPTSMDREEAEWHVAGFFEKPGLQRFQSLRRLLIDGDFSVGKLPPLVKRSRPFTLRKWCQECAPGDSFGVALGATGRSLARAGWDASLAIPNASQEDAEDAHLPELPLPSPYYPRRFTWEDQHGPDVGHCYVRGIRVKPGGAPCTPVGARGGTVITHPPFFDNPSLLYKPVRESEADHVPRQAPVVSSHPPPGFEPLPGRRFCSQRDLFTSDLFLFHENAFNSDSIW